MTTSQNVFLSEVSSEFDVIPAEKRAFLQERLRTRLYDLILGEFMDHQSRNPAFTKAALARRIGSRPEIINRILSSPGNWTIDTISNLLAGISGAELGLSADKFSEYHAANDTRPEWLTKPRNERPLSRAINVIQEATEYLPNIEEPVSAKVESAYLVVTASVGAL
jgi:hypothetical protein